MKSVSRSLRVGAALVLVVATLASCGGSGTGEGAAATKAPAAPVAATAAPTVAVAAPTPANPTFLILQGDTVRSPEGLTDEQKTYLLCVQQNRFPQGSRIVWRYKVLDPLTNKALDDKAIKSFDVTLPDNTKAAFKYGGHGGTKENPLEYFWTAGFSVPGTYPTGMFPFQITAVSNDGATGTWDQFKVPQAQVQIVAAGKP